MFAWLRELLEIRAEFRERNKICPSCETLKEIIATERFEKKQLLDKLTLEKPPVMEEPPANMTPIQSRMIPWRVKRQLLEAEDRKKAELLRNAPKPDAEVVDLEQELGLAEKARESEAVTG